MKFIDFCSGIVGGRLGLEKAGFSCIAFSEIDKAAIKTYKSLFNTKNELELGDLTKIKPEFLPDFDLLISALRYIKTMWYAMNVNVIKVLLKV
ncbi:DNA cytosine methyltransferase [Campylobacter hepaticus]|uniref:DNA cytosine methyltransferase n=1 Tax=Campylobacter hepaticus TaxID=1813019 RepID=UPI000828BB29|nr:DNA cytosine methyltransferase [Campylobacter hepaticus]MCZ0772293.1 DNA cytosine methyltransferase [Campylobacter hepaticus]MCZ0773761.1 DNA cytosine methyltransferase [Campylobacter hepaticus]MCZ0775012.1 DNA cytosine methyltransferase [Campylobacter hepaticus]MDX2322881.1 DNA cytosine methyltransferase [Campylobacter hepaticus]MDX2330570.1 DNA cytosine methyltransferase [Campylobacter hepaticus]